MTERVIAPTPTRPILDGNELQNQEFRTWAKIVTDRTLISGTGSPEGVIEATQLTPYMNETGTAGNLLWLKRDADIAGDTSLGWILV